MQERVEEHLAMQRIAGADELLPHREILSRLFLGPVRRSGRKRLDRRAAVLVTSNAAGMPCSLLQKNGLHPLLEKLEVGSGRGPRLRQKGQDGANQGCHHVLRSY